MNRYNTKALHFTDVIQSKLVKITEFPLTIVTAPMGYGKTTAVKKYLYNSSMTVLWHAIYDGSIIDF